MNSPKHPFKSIGKYFLKIKVLVLKMIENDRYNRYQFSHHSFSNDQKKGEGEKEYLNLQKDVDVFLEYQPHSPKWTLQLADSLTEP